MKPADLVRMLAPDEPAAKRRLARVLSEVATVSNHADGTPYLVLRDSTNRHPHPVDAHQHPNHLTISVSASALVGGKRRRSPRRARAGGLDRYVRHAPCRRA